MIPSSSSMEQCLSNDDDTELESANVEDIEKRQLKRAHRSNSDSTTSAQNINLRKKVNLGYSGKESNNILDQWLNADYSNLVSMNSIFDGSFINASYLFDSLPDFMGDLAHKVEPVQRNITQFEELPELEPLHDEKLATSDTNLPQLEFQLSRNSLMDDFTWSSGDIDKDLIAQVNDPDFWQKNMKDSSDMLTPINSKSNQSHSDQDIMGSLNEMYFESTSEHESFDNINRNDALLIVSTPNSNNSVEVLQEILPNKFDPKNLILEDAFTSFPDSTISENFENMNNSSISILPSRELPREDSYLPSVPVPMSSRASFTAGRQNAQRWNTGLEQNVNSNAMFSSATSPNLHRAAVPLSTNPNGTYNNNGSLSTTYNLGPIEETNAVKRKPPLATPTNSHQTKEKISNRGNYRCGRCGQPKVNHVCAFTDAVGVSMGTQVTNPIIDFITHKPFSGEKFITVSRSRNTIFQSMDVEYSGVRGNVSYTKKPSDSNVGTIFASEFQSRQYFHISPNSYQ